MAEVFPGVESDRAVAIDVAPNGKVLLLDRGGVRICTGLPDDTPSCGTLRFRSRDATFLDAHLVLLEEDRVHTLQLSGTPIGSMAVREGARVVAGASSGSLLVGYGPGAPHGLHLERLGSVPVGWSDDVLGGVTAIATDAGGFWVANGALVMRLRPAPGRLETARSIELPAPVRALATGPDGALYALLEPGNRMLRLFGDEQDEVQALDHDLLDIASGGRRLLGCGPAGVFDLTALVPPAAWNTPGKSC